MPPASDFPVTPAAPAARADAVRSAAVARPPRAGSLHGRLQTLLLAVVLLCLLAALLVQQWASREALMQQIERQDRESAAWLALALQRDVPDTVEQRDAVLGAHFAAARLSLLQLRDGEGRLVWQRRAEARPAWAPEAYVELLDLHPPGATLTLKSAAGKHGGSVHLRSQAADAADALWQGLLQTALVLALLGGVVLAGGAWRVRQIRQALRDAVEQANALSDGRYLRVAEPVLRELQPLASSMNLLVDRLQAVFDAQAAQLEVLRRQAHADALTGLPVRRHFIAQFEQLLAAESSQASLALLLLRVRDLQGMNRRIGHSATDHVLQAVAQTLTSYPQRSDGCFSGRMNGSDFALVLPVGGVAAETAQALVQALRMPLISIDAAAGVSIGAVELRGVVSVQQALALADEALALAESDKAFSVTCLNGDAGEVAPYGEAAWQQRLTQALEQGRVALGAFPVCTADGRVLHFDCPMRVQLEPGGAYQPASRWLAQATRARLCAAVDETAVQLALQAIEEDGQARCINIAAQSLGVSDFMAAVSRRLEAAPQAATRLWIDLPETLALDRPALVQEASRRWRPLGVYIGLEHAGQSLARMHRLLEMGLDCVRIDARYVDGLSDPAAHDARRYLRGLVQLVQSVGLSITAEGVRDENDLALLWTMGFDAATGPIVRAPETQLS
ncbi:EAL domain-containing protein [Aquabacterium sp.]|uniref:bifunctional diguanylate cyclase/phosphodiesterase n=1 Tax=Aquabacterium sp. TaxID=1872578 RepID=UPI003783076D